MSFTLDAYSNPSPPVQSCRCNGRLRTATTYITADITGRWWGVGVSTGKTMHIASSYSFLFFQYEEKK
jgi:hypothetical protein